MNRPPATQTPYVTLYALSSLAILYFRATCTACILGSTISAEFMLRQRTRTPSLIRGYYSLLTRSQAPRVASRDPFRPLSTTED